MKTLRRWIAYDTFKFVVALILLALLLVLLFQRPAAPLPASAGAVPQVSASAVQQQRSATLTSQPTATLIPPTSTATAQPTPAATTEPPPSTPTLAPTATLEPTATLSPEAPQAAQPAAVDCPLAAPSQLTAGQQALVITNLNLRKEAGMDQPILAVSLPNAKVDVIGGPVCIPYQSGAYLWWNVKAQDGSSGWSAEASLTKKFYFLQPVP